MKENRNLLLSIRRALTLACGTFSSHVFGALDAIAIGAQNLPAAGANMFGHILHVFVAGIMAAARAKLFSFLRAVISYMVDVQGSRIFKFASSAFIAKQGKYALANRSVAFSGFLAKTWQHHAPNSGVTFACTLAFNFPISLIAFARGLALAVLASTCEAYCALASSTLAALDLELPHRFPKQAFVALFLDAVIGSDTERGIWPDALTRMPQSVANSSILVRTYAAYVSNVAARIAREWELRSGLDLPAFFTASCSRIANGGWVLA